MAVEVPADVIRDVDLAAREVIPPGNMQEVSVLATLGGQLLGRLPRTLDGLSDASAHATVRAVALSDHVDALDLLTHYAQDPRPHLQAELVDCWRFFEPTRYAIQVLGDAPLLDGHIEVRDVAWLPYLHHLRRLSDAHVQIYPDWLDSLDPLQGLPGLTRLLARVRGRCSVSPLHASRALEYLNLTTTDEFTDLHDLSTLVNLRELVLLSEVQVHGIDFLHDLDRLERVEIDRIGPTVDLAPIYESKNLRVLGLRDCAATVDVAELARLPKLTRLDLRDHPHPLNLAPFENPALRIRISRGQRVTGVESTRSSVEVHRF
jgi:hypothetical protein